MAIFFNSDISGYLSKRLYFVNIQFTGNRTNGIWYSCDECVVAGQNVLRGPTIHLPRLECCVKSHHLHLIHLVYFCFQMRFQKKY